MIGPLQYADAVARNLGLKFSADDRDEVARLFKLAMAETRKAVLEQQEASQ